MMAVCQVCGTPIRACSNKYRCGLGACTNRYPCRRIIQRCPHSCPQQEGWLDSERRESQGLLCSEQAAAGGPITPSLQVSRPEVTYTYDQDEHHAAPVELCWARRKGDTSHTRWVFIRCCGALGTPVRCPDGSGVLVVRSERGCSGSAQPARMHPGDMVLLRATGSAVRKHGSALPTARWQCCRKVAIDRWDACWDLSNQGRVPQGLVATGCSDWDPVISAEGVSLTKHTRVGDADLTLARVARPSARRSRGHGSSGPSSGRELVVLCAELEVAVADVRPTQAFVCIDTFDGTRNVFDVMLDLYLRHLAPDDAGDDNAAPLAARLVLRPSPWPRMRIARDPESGERWCCDNRRLFMHKVLGCETACAQEVAWMQEFADKRRQAPPKGAEQAQAKAQEEGRYWSTDAEGVARAREELERRVHEVLVLRCASVRALFRALASRSDEELAALHTDDVARLLGRISQARSGSIDRAQ